jgi:hypothetical protein
MTSIFSPWSSRMIDCTRDPRIPTHAPTGSTSRSRERTATFAPLARLPHRSLDDDGAVVDLRHLHLEEPDQEPRVRTRKYELRALWILVDVVEDRADPLALPVALRAGLLVAGDDRLGLAEVDDHVAALEPLDRPVHQLAELGVVLVVDVVALGLADLLVEDLLGRLRAMRPEADRLAIDADLVAEHTSWTSRGASPSAPGRSTRTSPSSLLGDQRLRLVEQDLRRRLLDSVSSSATTVPGRVHRHLAALPVDQSHHGLVVVVLARGGGHGLFESAEHLLSVDVLLPRNLSDDRRIDDHDSPVPYFPRPGHSKSSRASLISAKRTL